MDIFFRDPNETPLPPNEVRILEFTATPYPDGRRVRVYLEVSPFQKRPSVAVKVHNSNGQAVAQTSIIESMTRKMEFTVHLRGPQPEGKHQMLVTLLYQSDPPKEENLPRETPKIVDEKTIEFDPEAEKQTED